MSKLLEFLNNNPDYLEYLKNRVEGNIKSESLSLEEISILREQVENEDKIIEELNKTLEESKEQ